MGEGRRRGHILHVCVVLGPCAGRVAARSPRGPRARFVFVAVRAAGQTSAGRAVGQVSAHSAGRGWLWARICKNMRGGVGWAE